MTTARPKTARRWAMPALAAAASTVGAAAAPAWLAWILPVFAWAPLTYPGFFEVHSGFAAIFNLTDLARHLSDLTWTPPLGQPYDLLRGARALPYLLALPLRLFGASSATAIKVALGLSILAGALGMFGWARRRFGPWPGLLAALVYALWPLGLATVYVRGAFAEACLLGLLPFVCWAAEGALSANDAPLRIGWRRAALLALALAAAFWTQAGLALWAAVIVLVFILVGAREGNRKERRERKETAALWGWLAGVALGGVGLLPLLVRRGLGGGAWPVFTEHLVYPHQLLLANWGQGVSVPGADDTLTFQLGLMACGLAVVGGVLWSQRREAGRAANLPPDALSTLGRTLAFAAALVLGLALLSSTLAWPFWRGLPFLARTLAYPWQLLLLAGPWLAWLAALGGRMLLDALPVSDASTADALGADVALSAARPTAAVAPLFAGLLGLALLGSYAMLNPTGVAQPPDQPLAVFGDGEIALVSGQAFGLVDPARPITATVVWQALRPLDTDYTVFFQAIGPDGKLWGQQDTMPLAGELPTSQWRPGQVINDEYRIFLKGDAPGKGRYEAHIGLYFWQTGARLRTAADDKVVLTAP